MPFAVNDMLNLSIESVTRNRDLGQQSAVLLLEFSKAAFDTVPHRPLLNKLNFYGISGDLNTRLEQWLTTRHQRAPANCYSREIRSAPGGRRECAEMNAVKNE